MRQERGPCVIPRNDGSGKPAGIQCPEHGPEFIDFGLLVDLSLPSTVLTAASPPPTPSHQEIELAPTCPLLANPRAGEKTPPNPPLENPKNGDDTPDVTPPGPGRPFAGLANQPGKPAPAPKSTYKTAETFPQQAANPQPRGTTPNTSRPSATTKREGGQPRGPAGGKRRKPRHWCFDCRRHGHAHQVYPTPTGDLFRTRPSEATSRRTNGSSLQ
ncbi:proline-rich receptor-like protein kinase PERK9 [Fopius arisanus]|uniref:Proline-rich receptor-like protein kinase PERK9 n=1 Tax=Fopius arisanus TaxID=64838 RepID=A0A9R1TQ02_9HYME|nr:PREDICTED: proline-rich receptor-like protein kinase PERK9 [Fopius arisanus]